MGCINAKPSRDDDIRVNGRERATVRQPLEYMPPSRASLLTKEEIAISGVVNESASGNLVERKGGGPNGLPVEHAIRNRVKPEDVCNSGPIKGVAPKSREVELIAAGWPSWLVSAAGEALDGWVPRKAGTFEKLDKIGQGTYSSVYKARDLTHGKIVALKKVRFDNLDPESVTFMAREILILRRLDHPNVIKLEGLIASSESCSLYLVFEYMEHDLTGLASLPGNKFSEPQVKCYMEQLFSGLEHCHARGVLHRDIKGSNLLIDDSGILKIADFGLATFYDPQHNVPMTSRVVTLWYRPPELLLGARQYSNAVDLWSAGCILGELYSGKPLMPGRTEVEQLHAIFKLCGSPSDDFWIKSKLRHAAAFKPQQPYKNRISERLKDIPSTALALVETLLSVDPSFRGSATSALQSEFFTTEPLACDPSSLPKYPPSKEIDAKLRADQLKRREATEGGRRIRPDQGKQRPQHYEAAQADKANADLIASVQMQERKRQSVLMNRSETFNSDLDAPSSQRTFGHQRILTPVNSRSGEQTFDKLYSSKVAAYSGPLTQRPTAWSNAEKKPIDLHVAQRGTNKASPILYSTSASIRNNRIPTQDPQVRHNGALLNNQKQGGGAYRQSSRFSQFRSDANNTGGGGGDDGVYHSHNVIYPYQYEDRAHLRRSALLESFKDNSSQLQQDDKIHFSGPLGLPSRNMEEMLRERDRQMQEAARRSRIDKLKQNQQVATAHLLVPSR